MVRVTGTGRPTAGGSAAAAGRPGTAAVSPTASPPAGTPWRKARRSGSVSMFMRLLPGEALVVLGRVQVDRPGRVRDDGHGLRAAGEELPGPGPGGEGPQVRETLAGEQGRHP